MTKFTFVTLFPELISNYFSDSILKKAINSKLLEVDFVSPRDFTTNKHLKTDDTLTGGGAGMLMQIEPLFNTVNDIVNKSKNSGIHVILTSPVGKLFTQKDAKRLAKKEHLVFISGRYQGIDERVTEQIADEVFSIGDFILTGGELPSLIMCDAISRNIDGVLGNSESMSQESYEDNYLLEAPNFSKPNIFNNSSVVSEYLNGNHKKIENLKLKMAESKTKFFRPDLFLKYKNLQKFKINNKKQR
jgi:tRNA (guanine37-N1)-methyltransferase